MSVKAASFRFKPFSKKQKKVLTWWVPGSPYADYDGIIADGSVRSGKTIVFIVAFIQWSTACFTGQNFIIAGKSMGALKRNVISPMLMILRTLGIKFRYNRSEHFLEFGGNTYYLFGGVNESSQDVVQGITAAGALLDEAALMPRSFVEQVFARCSVDGSKYWLNCNPESPHHYVKVEIIDKARKKRFLHLHFTMEDNLTLSRRVRERYERMYSGVWHKRYILGLWVAAEGAIYDMLDPDKHVIDVLPAMREYYVGTDYGTASVTVFWLLGVGVDDRLYLVDFLRWDAKKKGQQRTDLEHGAALAEWLIGRGIVPRWIFVPDDAQSFIEQLRRMRENYECLRHVDVADRSPGSVKDGIRSVASLLGAMKLLFSREVERKGGLKEMIGYTWDPKKQEKGEDAPLKENDHDCDAIRGLIRGTVRVWKHWIKEAA